MIHVHVVSFCGEEKEKEVCSVGLSFSQVGSINERSIQ